MQCPHCTKYIHEQWSSLGSIDGDADHSDMRVQSAVCPACERRIVVLLVYKGNKCKNLTVYPEGVVRPIPSEVPNPYASDFREAVAVLPHSAKASAALSRRNLQAIIRDKAGIKRRDLSQEIEELIKLPGFPSELAGNVDAVRNVGNFAAHPMKTTNTGEILDVEPHEADWLLEVLEGLFDFYFVQPAASKARRAALDAKLASAGKPPMKSS